MSDFLTIESVKNALVECPICTEYFHGDSRIPRRMPCCTQTICDPCLEAYSQGRQTIPCPLCCQTVSLDEGTTSLPREMVVLRFLDLLETQSNFFPSCTDCPGKCTAIAKCDTCRILLCQGCLKAHHKNPETEDHITATFERAGKEQQMRRKTVRQLHSNQQVLGGSMGSSLDQRTVQLGNRIDQLQGLHDNVIQSEASAEEQINQVFDELTLALQQRRETLLSELKTLRGKETKEVSLALDSYQVLQFKLQKATRSRRSVTSFSLEEHAQDVDFVKKGITFVRSNIAQLSATIREAGLLRSVTFTPTDRPENIDEASHCNAVGLVPASLPQGSTLDQILVLNKSRAKPITCPYLEFDPNTAGADITISGSVATNTKPKQPILKSGCRLQAPRTLIVTKPLIREDDARYMFAVKVGFRLIQGIPVRKAIVEIALTANPIDMNFSQIRGMSISVASCHFHKQHQKDLCLVVETSVERIYCHPVVRNVAGIPGELYIAVLVDYVRNAIHILDAAKSVMLATVHNMVLDKPLWTMMYLGRPEWTAIRGELVSGRDVKVSRNLLEVL